MLEITSFIGGLNMKLNPLNSLIEKLSFQKKPRILLKIWSQVKFLVFLNLLPQFSMSLKELLSILKNNIKTLKA